jgi:hypothetical protein
MIRGVEVTIPIFGSLITRTQYPSEGKTTFSREVLHTPEWALKGIL